MLSENMLAAISDQATKEFYSAYLYLQMAAWFENQTLPGCANWMKVQAQEELSHGMIFFNYVAERGGMMELGAMEDPPADYASPIDIFEKALAHEEMVTSRINHLMDMAIEEKDYATKARLDWFITEQVEEEANASELVGKLRLIANDSNGLFVLDKELAARVFAMPSPLVGGK